MGGAVKRFAPNTEHLVRVESDGYSPSERRVTLTVDTSLAIELNAEPTPSATHAEEAHAKHRNGGSSYRPLGVVSTNSTTPPAAKSGKSASCSPPYYFVGGIKTFKPECI